MSQGSVCCEISAAKFPVPQRSKQSPGHLGGTLLAAATPAVACPHLPSAAMDSLGSVGQVT